MEQYRSSYECSTNSGSSHPRATKSLGLELILRQTGPLWGYPKDSLSVVLRCRQSITRCDPIIGCGDKPLGPALSSPYLVHPQPSAWLLHGTHAFPLLFPPLEKLVLGDSAARG